MVCLVDVTCAFCAFKFQLLLSYAGFRIGDQRNPSVQSRDAPLKMDFMQEKSNQLSMQFGIISEEGGRWVRRGLEA
jgi:hypothetical protein